MAYVADRSNPGLSAGLPFLQTAAKALAKVKPIVSLAAMKYFLNLNNGQIWAGYGAPTVAGNWKQFASLALAKSYWDVYKVAGIAQVNYWWADPVTKVIRWGTTSPGPGWRGFEGSTAGRNDAVRWLASSAKPVLPPGPPSVQVPLSRPLISMKPPTGALPTQPSYWWGNPLTGEVSYGIMPATTAGAAKFATQAEAQALVARYRPAVPQVYVKPPVEVPTVVTLPSGQTVPATPVTTTGGQVVAVPAGTQIPVVMPTGEVRGVDATVVAAAKPTETAAKILGLPPLVFYLGAAAVVVLVVMPMLKKRGGHR